MHDRLKNSDVDRLRVLNDVVPKLNGGDQNFARSLIANWSRWKKLSEKQWEWVQKLTERGQGIEVVVKPAKPTFPIPGFEAVAAKLFHAATIIQFPAIRLETGSGCKVVLRPKINHSGVSVRWNGERFGNVIQENFIPEHDETIETKLVVELLKAFAADPIQAAKEYGLKTKSCCFCGLGLINPSSVHHGYGPICAENYGLPWGDLPPVELTTEEEELAKHLERGVDYGLNLAQDAQETKP